MPNAPDEQISVIALPEVSTFLNLPGTKKAT